jgi:hypothetical protein
MTFKDARKLHNGDEVVDKETGESISVLNTRVQEKQGPGSRGSVLIEGIGEKQGHGEWLHVQVG